jgi:hypothetical protein
MASLIACACARWSAWNALATVATFAERSPVPRAAS